MRRLFILAFLVTVSLSLASPFLQPSRVAVHFGAGGVPDGWGSGVYNACVLLAIEVLLFSLMYFSPRLLNVVPPGMINLPNKAYWLAPANLVRAQAKLASFMYQFGAVFFVFLLTVVTLAIQANRSQPVRLNEPLLLAALGGLLIYSIAWCIALFRSFRIPPSTEGTPPATAPAASHSRTPAAMVLAAMLGASAAYAIATSPAARRASPGESKASCAASAELACALAGGQTNTATWMSYAQRLQCDGQPADAAEAYAKVLAREPYNQAAWVGRAAALAAVGDEDKLAEFLTDLVLANAKLAVEVFGRSDIQPLLRSERLRSLREEALSQSMD